MKNVLLALFASLILISHNGFSQQPELEGQDAPSDPNFLVVVVDDMGWSDIGVLGGEIRTPNIDELAADGIVMTDYYVAPTCAPTRSMLMTGVDNHLTGLGVMAGIRAPNQVGKNYEARLHDEVVTVAEVLTDRGYQAFMSGKWHLGDGESGPHARGFDRSFTLLPGGASHFSDLKPISPMEPAEYQEDGEHVELPEDFYSSISYTDKLLEYLDARDPDAPFFAYLAFTAPHDPLQVPDEWSDRYAGAYSQGPVATRQARAQRQRDMGLIPEDARLWQYPRFPSWFPNHLPVWEERSAERRERDARPMEIFASMVELVDQQIGRVIASLEESGEMDNTYVIFFSDNGASQVYPMIYPGVTDEWFSENWSNAHETRGQPGNFGAQGPEWASVSGTPWKHYKNTLSEGGIRSPLVVSGPLVPEGERSNALARVSDIPVTIYDLIDFDPSQDPLFENKTLPQGYSLLPIWTGEQEQVRTTVGTELFGNRGLRRGDWKISYTQAPVGSGQWELYNLALDPGEMNNVATQNPEILDELKAEYQAYVERNEVIHPEPPSLVGSLRRISMVECDWWCTLRFEIINRLPAK